jgi:hypothetical protein
MREFKDAVTGKNKDDDEQQATIDPAAPVAPPASKAEPSHADSQAERAGDRT